VSEKKSHYYRSLPLEFKTFRGFVLYLSNETLFVKIVDVYVKASSF